MSGFSAIALYAPRRDCNIGGAMRAAYCYDASLMIIKGRMAKYSSDTPKSWRHVPVIETEDIFKHIPYDCVPVAVELVENARNLVNYIHPKRALYIFGPENGSLGKSVLEKCRDIVYIPTKRCMNLAATVNVVLYDRMTKRTKK